MNYIRILFHNVEPLRIADDSSSQGNQTDALSYVPGTALRGAVIDNLVREGEFESHKKTVLSDDISFLNAYPVMDGREMMPSLKGFYEDKTDAGTAAKPIENMLIDGQITPGNKRASIGRYCYLEDGCIRYASLKMGSDLRMNHVNSRKGSGDDEKNVFRQEYVKPGYNFAAYIGVSDDLPEEKAVLFEAVKRIHKDQSLLLGGGRSYGYGKCVIDEVGQTSALPYAEYCDSGELSDVAYMILLSDTSMRNEDGTLVGMDFGILQEKLGLSHMEHALQSTSIVDVRGYNRTWGTWMPAVNMYEMGSVFKLTFNGETISEKAAQSLMHGGLGMRTNEGYGRVLLIAASDYEKISSKLAIVEEMEEQAKDDEPLDESEERTLRIAAKGHYMNLIKRMADAYVADPQDDFARFHLDNTQMGTVESVILANLYDDAFGKLKEYFEHAKETDDAKRVQQVFRERKEISAHIGMLRVKSLHDIFPELPRHVMGLRLDDVLSEDEVKRIKLNLVVSQIKYHNRGGNGDE